MSLSNIFNILNTSNQRKVSIVKIKFAQKYVKLLDILLKEGFIRGYFVNLENGFKTICILLKHPFDNYLFNYKRINQQKFYKYNNLKYTDFNFIIDSSNKGFISRKKAITLKSKSNPIAEVL